MSIGSGFKGLKVQSFEVQGSKVRRFYVQIFIVIKLTFYVFVPFGFAVLKLQPIINLEPLNLEP